MYLVNFQWARVGEIDPELIEYGSGGPGIGLAAHGRCEASHLCTKDCRSPAMRKKKHCPLKARGYHAVSMTLFFAGFYMDENEHNQTKIQR